MAEGEHDLFPVSGPDRPRGILSLNDNPTAAYFADQNSRAGDRPMLGRLEPEREVAVRARRQLLKRFVQDEQRLVQDFSRECAMTSSQFQDGENAFQIHEAKMGDDLVAFLVNTQLAWEPTRPVRGGAKWWAVHPALGETIMSTNALALAGSYGLEIVTDARPIDHALVGATEETVYDRLIGDSIGHESRSTPNMVDDVMRFIFVNTFDMDKLSLNDVVALHKEKADIAALKAEIASELRDLPGIPDREAWETVLKKRTQEVVERWRSRTSLMKNLREIASGALSAKAENILDKAGSVLKTPAGSAVLIKTFMGLIPGIAVGLIFAGAKVYGEVQKKRRPYRLLSTLDTKLAEGAHLLTLSPL